MSSIKPIDTSKIKKILIIQLQPFGDVFIATSPLEALKKHIPQAEIYFLVYKPYHKVLENHPYIDHIIAINKGKGWKYYINRITTFFHIYKQHFDIVIDQQTNPNTQIISFLSGARHRIGTMRGQFAFVYNHKVPRGKAKYSGCSKFDLLSPLGISEQPFKYYYHIKDKAHHYIQEWLNNFGLTNKDFIIFSPGSPETWKKWRGTYYAALGDLIWKELGLQIVLLWAKSEYEDCYAITELMVHKPLLAPETDLNQAMALLCKTKLLVCNDGGLNHISCATETPTIAIFGCTNPVHWSPATVFTHHRHLYNTDSQKRKDDNFGITPEDVVREIRDFLKLGIQN